MDKLLFPVHRRHLCSLFNCSLKDAFWCNHPASCPTCKRQYCDKYLATTYVDFKGKDSYRKIGDLKFAIVECVFCIGISAFSQNRRKQLLSILREIFPACSVEGLQQGVGMRRDDMRMNQSSANAFRNAMCSLHWMGLRDEFEFFCQS